MMQTEGAKMTAEDRRELERNIKELAARASGAVEGEDGHLVIFVGDKPEKEPETKMQCPECGLDFDKMAEWMNKNIDIEDII